MIRTLKHRGLKRLYESDNNSGVLSQYVPKMRRILFALDNATTIKEMDLPGFRIHPLSGDLKGF
jgi:proteic killer suppression protein